MARYQHDDDTQTKPVPVHFDRQILPGTMPCSARGRWPQTRVVLQSRSLAVAGSGPRGNQGHQGGGREPVPRRAFMFPMLGTGEALMAAAQGELATNL